ncbi:unnamed protein product [Rotaria socialis]|uniref:Malectin domain-containing protein n=2 Tax=Rotaria socialis TaxID=392032 RepID=A0A820CZR1_9BILA|nr:unnamed protein product [Rotaria socialis]CAF3446463.1 unnamed protein product [Rotaria socialis]CAF3646316.1 unnamed protein product [Rotaria socialis]CAF4223416.1 unnamed protein product [Rotaria socialis]CAF4393239.1 unnamed protein product [Rotaria socialis]
MKSIYLFIYFIHQCYSAGIMDHVIYAVNCGGEAHTDVNGIRYRKDYLKAGINSDYGRNSFISRVAKEDMILYQTERYDLQSFSYEIDVIDDGDYVLWLKFAEVWFNAPNMKVFQILLNDEHSVIDELDIFAKAGRSTAHDEYIPFQIKNGRLVLKSRSSSYSGKLKVTFEKLDGKDNPKINALVIWKGSIDQIPKLLPVVEPETPEVPTELEDEDEAPAKAAQVKRSLKPSGPKVVDPYTEDQSSSLMPLLIAIAAVIPVIFCLCRF